MTFFRISFPVFLLYTTPGVRIIVELFGYAICIDGSMDSRRRCTVTKTGKMGNNSSINVILLAFHDPCRP